MMMHQLIGDDSAKQTYKRVRLAALFILLVQLGISAQTTAQVQAQSDDTTMVWTVEDCMRYAVAHSHGLRQRELQLDNSGATRLQAIGAFLPSVNASTGTQWNFGRAIDPETNTYTSVSTFNNGYGLSTSLPVFDGLYRVHALRAARADVLMQKNALQAEREQVALETYQAYVNVVYAQEAVRLAEEKLSESKMILRQTQVMEEEGLKSPADVAQIEAQVASDELMLTRQEGQRETNMLELRKVMNRPAPQSLTLGSLTPDPSPKGEGSIYLQELNIYSEQGEEVTTPLSSWRGVGGEASGGGSAGAKSLLVQSFYAVESARHSLRATRSSFFPSISLSAGINSSYYRNLDAATTSPFRNQLKNNLGEYVSLNLSIPIFNRLGNIASLRRARNNLCIAQEQYAAKQTELEVLRQQACLDVLVYQKEATQGERKVAADSLAYELTRQQYAQGLASPIDLQTSAAILLQSRAALLQSRLMIFVKKLQRRYYEGLSLI